MPITHWACPEDKPTFGEAHTPEFCITECPHKCVSPFLIAALTTSNRRNHHKGKYLSATSLSGCNRKLKAERTIDYAEFMKNALYGYRGTVMHQVVEDAAEIKLSGLGEDGEPASLASIGYLTEWRMLIGFCLEHGGFRVPDTVDVHDKETYKHLKCPQEDQCSIYAKDCEWFLLGGTLDGMEPKWGTFDEDTGVLHGILWDLKTMGTFALRLFILGSEDKKNDGNQYHPNVKDNYVIQANIYKYLAERSTPPKVLRDRGVTDVRLDISNIQAFGMSDFPRTGQPYMFRKHWKHDYAPFDIPEIEFWKDEEIEAYIKEKGAPIYESLILDRDRGSICEPEKNSYGLHSWLCKFCAFHGSSICPAPDIEWEALQNGATREEAFQEALDALEE